MFHAKVHIVEFIQLTPRNGEKMAIFGQNVVLIWSLKLIHLEL